MTAAVLITNTSDSLLVLHPANPDTANLEQANAPWQLPGGIVEPPESPLDAVRREAREELGLDLDLGEGDLFAVEWLQATRPGRRNRLAFLFAGPTLLQADTSRITLQREEVDEWRWATRLEAYEMLHPAIVRRIVSPLRSVGAIYRETRHRHHHEGTR
ncbi:NUDIX hydrolase [Streptomyces sp. NPDC007100]|uniref:NUDIX hydrolase n=1 Tax=Streptomyces sp. NPDC007100 TaxID=3155602 RepID=UPI0033EA26F0